MDSMTPGKYLIDGWYIFSFGKAYAGPFRPVYAKGFIDGLRKASHATIREFYLVEVKNGQRRIAHGKSSTGTRKTDK